MLKIVVDGMSSSCELKGNTRQLIEDIFKANAAALKGLASNTNMPTSVLFELMSTLLHETAKDADDISKQIIFDLDAIRKANKGSDES